LEGIIGVDNPEEFRCISLCTGCAGIELGLREVIPNLRTIAYVEVEAFAVANLVAKIEEGKLDAAPVWTDIKTFDGEPFRDRVHLITGGYPCQPFSVAGKRKGEADPRHLWPHIERIIKAVRPVYGFFENVSGHLTIGFPTVYRSLRNMGYSVEAGLFTAAECGAPHRRERLFILAYTRDNQQREIGRYSQKKNGFAQKGQQANRWNAKSLSSSEQLANTTEQGFHKGNINQAGQIARYNSWPVRPGQPQYEWEEPRVVANAKPRKQRGRTGNRLGGGQRKQEKTAENNGRGHNPQTQPQLDRAVNGPQSRVDRLRLLGNGVVPQCAAKAWESLIREL